jgi:DNA-binding transcriptional ArsR family regulator
MATVVDSSESLHRAAPRSGAGQSGSGAGQSGSGAGQSGSGAGQSGSGAGQSGHTHGDDPVRTGEDQRRALADAVDLLKALAAEVRLAVVAELGNGPRRVGELRAALHRHDRDVSQPLLSQHLKVLRDAGLVTTTRVGTEITYQLTDDRVGHLVDDALQHASRGAGA